jgi:hypothetical protein
MPSLNTWTRDMDWIEIASADDDMIAAEVLEWSGHSDFWNEHELDEEYNFVSDVLEGCRHAWIDAEEWDGGVPGQSGIWHTVSADDPDALKAEIRARIEELVVGRG